LYTYTCEIIVKLPTRKIQYLTQYPSGPGRPDDPRTADSRSFILSWYNIKNRCQFSYSVI